MILENKLNLTNQVDLAKAEEELSKRRAKQLFDSGDIDKVEEGTYQGLAEIHAYLFEEIYYFSGKLREVNMAKGNFRFASVMYLESSLQHIDKMPQSSFDEIVEKYVEMKQVVDWNRINKEDYLSAMERSVVKDIEIKHLLREALTNKIGDRELYMKGIDVSYYYEGYTAFKTEEL